MLGESWWYLTSFQCILWGHVPPTTSHQLRHLLAVTKNVIDFVLRDRLGLPMPVDEEQLLRLTGRGGDGLWVQVSLPLDGARQVSMGEPGDDDTIGLVIGTELEVLVWRWEAIYELKPSNINLVITSINKEYILVYFDICKCISTLH